MHKLTIDQAARLALAAQGFNESRPSGRVDVRHFRRALRRMGVLQLDSVNVLVRSHYLQMFSRLGGYDRSSLDRWTARSGELFEYWGHMASLIPVGDYPLYRWRMESAEPGQRIRRLMSERPGYIETVHREVLDEGPLAAGDLDDGGERTGPWWGYAPGKLALEWLFHTGDVTAHRNRAFGRVYADPSRVIPSEVLSGRTPSEEEAYRLLLLAAARHHGVGTASDLSDYHRLHGPTARQVIRRLADEGLLETVEVEGWKQPAYLYPAAILPRERRGTALLSPFDPLVWYRDRTERLFGFHYRIEIYVPASKRIHGYFVLPFLMDGRLVGRVDLKADRANGRLLVRSTFHEPAVDVDAMAASLAKELVAMAEWLELGDVVVEPRGNAADELRRALSAG